MSTEAYRNIVAAKLAKIEQRIQSATDAFNHGFYAKSHRQDAVDQLNRAYDALREDAHQRIVDAVNEQWPWNAEGSRSSADWDKANAFYEANDLPFGLHQVRDRHLPILETFGGYSKQVAELIELRAAIKAAPILPVIKDETKAKVEKIRETLIEFMDRRHTQFLEAVEIGHEFGGLPVTVNAHWVDHEKGTRYLRHFFYLDGKFTALNVILAAAQQLEKERKQAEEAAH